MNITLLTVGKLKEKYLQQGIQEYTKRLQSYCKIKQIEVKDEQAPDTLSEAEEEQIKRIEGERLLQHMKADWFCIALAIHGKAWSSEELAQQLDHLVTYGNSDICFVIGGSLGLSKEVLQRSDAKLSFSKMTFPHQLMRLILLEQLYRACRINAGHPYHK